VEEQRNNIASRGQAKRGPGTQPQNLSVARTLGSASIQHILRWLGWLGSCFRRGERLVERGVKSAGVCSRLAACNRRRCRLRLSRLVQAAARYGNRRFSRRVRAPVRWRGPCRRHGCGSSASKLTRQLPAFAVDAGRECDRAAASGRAMARTARSCCASRSRTIARMDRGSPIHLEIAQGRSSGTSLRPPE